MILIHYSNAKHDTKIYPKDQKTEGEIFQTLIKCITDGVPYVVTGKLIVNCKFIENVEVV